MKCVFSFTSSEDGVSFKEDRRLTFPGESAPYIPEQGDVIQYPSKHGGLALRSRVLERPEITYQAADNGDVAVVILTFKVETLRAV
jgi:hypothetical protein